MNLMKILFSELWLVLVGEIIEDEMDVISQKVPFFWWWKIFSTCWSEQSKALSSDQGKGACSKTWWTSFCHRSSCWSSPKMCPCSKCSIGIHPFSKSQVRSACPLSLSLARTPRSIAWKWQSGCWLGGNPRESPSAALQSTLYRDSSSSSGLEYDWT